MCSTLRESIPIAVPLGLHQTRRVLSHPFTSEGVVWFRLTGKPQGSEGMAIVNIAHFILFVRFSTLIHMRTYSLSDLAFVRRKENGGPYGFLDRNYKKRSLNLMRLSNTSPTSPACSVAFTYSP